jgi:hypothetical protein
MTGDAPSARRGQMGRLGKGGNMNFEVNGIPYFLTFDAREAQWCLLTPFGDGIEELEIHDDGPLAAPEAHPSNHRGTRRTN